MNLLTDAANSSLNTAEDHMTSLSRRSVLKTLALGSTAFLFSPHSLLAATRPVKDKLGIALVGLGYYSTEQ